MTTERTGCLENGGMRHNEWRLAPLCRERDARVAPFLGMRIPFGTWASPCLSPRTVVIDAPPSAPSIDVLGHAVRTSVERIKGEPSVRMGRLVVQRAAAEVSVFVERSPTVGAVATVRATADPDEMGIVVSPLSPRHRRLQWLLLSLSLPVSFAVLAGFGPYRAASVALFAALLGGCLLAMAGLRALAQVGVGMDVAASAALAERVARRLRTDLAREWGT